MANKRKMTMGLIVGNRAFFSDPLAKSGREEMIQALHRADLDVVALTPEQSKYGAVETHEEAKRCAELFRSRGDGIGGFVILSTQIGEELDGKARFAEWGVLVKDVLPKNLEYA
jgi:L-fucose isomerase-like protein